MKTGPRLSLLHSHISSPFYHTTSTMPAVSSPAPPPAPQPLVLDMLRRFAVLPPPLNLSPPAAALQKKQVKAAAVKNKFVIDCSKPCKDNLMEIGALSEFLSQKIKVNGKVGVLGDDVTVTTSDSKVHVATEIAFSKRYLKYLTKKFLKKQQLRDWLRVIASNKTTYELRYFNINEEDDEEDEEDA